MNKNTKFETNFITPIQKIKKILEKDPKTIITPEQIKNFIENKESMKSSHDIGKKKVKDDFITSNISRHEAISRMCDFD
jgi:hypothetical protein